MTQQSSNLYSLVATVLEYFKTRNRRALGPRDVAMTGENCSMDKIGELTRNSVPVLVEWACEPKLAWSEVACDWWSPATTRAFQH